MGAVRIAAVLAIGAAAIGYLHERAWLDALNAWLWIAVVVLLEFEVRKPDAVRAHRARFGRAPSARVPEGRAYAVAVARAEARHE